MCNIVCYIKNRITNSQEVIIFPIIIILNFLFCIFHFRMKYQQEKPHILTRIDYSPLIMLKSITVVYQNPSSLSINSLISDIRNKCLLILSLHFSELTLNLINLFFSSIIYMAAAYYSPQLSYIPF